MGSNYFADEPGNFTLEVTRYSDGAILGAVVLNGLEPFTKIDSEVVVGVSR